MNWIKTKEQARQYGIEIQKWASEKDLSYEELTELQGHFIRLARKFHLVREFKENGLI